MNSKPYQVKKVIGGKNGIPEYSPAVIVHIARDAAINDAAMLSGTFDVFAYGERIARGHVDGGIDFYS